MSTQLPSFCLCVRCLYVCTCTVHLYAKPAKHKEETARRIVFRVIFFVALTYSTKQEKKEAEARRA